MNRSEFLKLLGLIGLGSCIEEDMNIRNINWWSGGSTTTSAFDDIWGWWRADEISGESGSYVLSDKSGNSRDMVQQSGTVTLGTASNGAAKIVGDSSSNFLSTGEIKSWPVTVITVGKRNNTVQCGMFGHTGATGYNTLWTGYDAANTFYIYNSNFVTNNTTGINDTCWVSRIGYGSRITIINGVIQNQMTTPSILQSSEIAVCLGTEYRGLNFDFYETLVWDRTLSFDELDEVHSYINTRYSMSIPLWSSYTSTPHVCLHGQSNASGRAARGASDVNVPEEYKGNQTGVKIWFSTWQQFNIASNINQLGEGGNLYFGMETIVGKEYVDLHGGNIQIFKYCLGNTTLNFKSGSSYWNPDNNTVMNNTLRLYYLMFFEWFKSLRANQTASIKPDIKGIIWFQGENDAINIDYSNNYQDNVLNFFNLYKQELGFGNNVKIFIVKIHKDIAIANYPYKATVRSAQAAAASIIKNCTLLTVDQYSLIDIVHVGADAQIGLAQEIAPQL